MEGTNETNGKKKLKKWQIALIIVIALVFVAAIGNGIGGEDSSQSDDQNQTSESDAETSGADETTEEPVDKSGNENEPEKTEFGVGETAELDDVQITLLNATESSGNEYIIPDEGNIFLILEFEIANNSNSDITISSIANFEAYCDDYALNQDIMGLQVPEAEGKNQLDGSVASGRKMNGIIAYQVPSDYSAFEISVSPDFWSANDINFVINK